MLFPAPRSGGPGRPVTPPPQHVHWSGVGRGLLEPGGSRGPRGRTPSVPPASSGGSKSSCRGISASRWSRPGAPTVPLAAGQGAHLSPECTEPEWNQAGPAHGDGGGGSADGGLRAPPAPGGPCRSGSTLPCMPWFLPPLWTLAESSSSPRSWQAVGHRSRQDSVCTRGGSDGCDSKANHPEGSGVGLPPTPFLPAPPPPCSPTFGLWKDLLIDRLRAADGSEGGERNDCGSRGNSSCRSSW